MSLDTLRFWVFITDVKVSSKNAIRGKAAAAKSLQSCPTLCDPIDHQAPLSLGFSRQEYWSGLPFPSPVHESEKSKYLSRVRLSATPWTAAHQAPPSMGFSRQEYWSRLPLSTNTQTRLSLHPPHPTPQDPVQFCTQRPSANFDKGGAFKLRDTGVEA